jgi:putative ABC transport system permease protein
MISLARANLLHDWRRHAAGISVLVMAALLLNIQIGMMLGAFESFSAIERELRADLIVQAKRTPLLGQSGTGGITYSSSGIERSKEGHIWMHPNVLDVQPYATSMTSMGMWQGKNGVEQHVNVVVVSPADASMTYPASFPDALRKVLATPGAVVLPRAAARSLGVALGDRARLGKAEVVVGGIVDGLGGMSRTRVFASSQTAKMGEIRGMGGISSFLVRLGDAGQTAKTLKELSAMLAPVGLSVETPEQAAFDASLEKALLGNLGKMFLSSVGFAFLISLGVVTQTLRSAMLAQVREFGALRALGIGTGRISFVAMEQAFWSGLISLVIAVAISLLVEQSAAVFGVAISLPVDLLLGSSALLMAITLVAGVISLSAITRVEPADLLR